MLKGSQKQRSGKRGGKKVRKEEEEVSGLILTPLNEMLD